MVMVVALLAALKPLAVPSKDAWVMTLLDGKLEVPSLLLLVVATELPQFFGAGGMAPLTFKAPLQVSVKVPWVPSL
jgi:hypothetical protein